MQTISHPAWRELLSACCILLATLAPPLLRAADSGWPVYLGDAGATRYSPLRQIDRGNVARLAPAWTFHTGETAGNALFSCNPLVIDGVLYGTTPQFKLIALDAARGFLLWRFDPWVGRRRAGTATGRNSGLASWTDGRDRRLFYTAAGFLYAVAAATGKPIATFGAGGRIDLFPGLDRQATPRTPLGASVGAVHHDLLLVSTQRIELPGPIASGQIRAFDVRTGESRWAFPSLPLPGAPPSPAPAPAAVGHDSTPTIDHDRGLAFIPTGPAGAIHWGGQRAGANLFANCLLALEIATGRPRWHFQFVHHDLWDSGLPAPPVLCSVTRQGKKIPAVAQITRLGQVWVFHRETGESLFPWREQPVPASTLPGEVASPTQPWPERPEPFIRQRFTAEQLTHRSPAAHAAVLAQWRAAAPHEPFAPPGPQDTLMLSAYDSGGDEGGAAVDPAGMLYVNGSELAGIIQMHPTRADGSVPVGQTLFLQLCAGCHGPDRTGNPAANIPSLVNLGARLGETGVAEMLHRGKGMMPPFAFLTGPQQAALIAYVRGLPAPEPAAASPVDPPYTTAGSIRFLDPDGFPALRPPWGTLNALDLNTGEYRWRRPLGELPAPAGAGPVATGTENHGGPLVTAGGLLFIGATPDEKLRAFDTADGGVQWEFKLPAGGYATPATYAVAGRQFVVIACGGGRMGTKPGGAYVAFALPEP